MKFTFGSGVNDSIFGKCQDPIKMFLERQGEAFEQASPLKKLFMMGTDNKYGVTMGGMTAMRGFLPVPESGEYPMDEVREGYKKHMDHVTWKNRFVISMEAVEDGLLMDLRQKPAAFIKAFHRNREEFGAQLFAGAMSGKDKFTIGDFSFDLTCADGKKLFAKDHPSKLGKAAQSNLFADAFSAKALSAAETRMQHFAGDAGNILDVAPTTILIPNDETAKETVFSVIGADKDPATSNNAFNYQFGRWNVICWTYLDRFLTKGTDFPWVLLDDAYNQMYGGAVWFDRKELHIRSELAHNDDNEWLGNARWSAGFNDWRFACVGGISGGTQLISSQA